jgi:hypothetical protein
MDLLLLILRLLLTAALYLFLGAVLLLLWRNLSRPSETGAVTPRRIGHLVTVDVGGDDSESPPALKVGARFPLQPVTSLGRSAVNTVAIPDVYASAEHALLVYRGDQWWLEDRGSRNGTTLNSSVINGPMVLSAGDIIGIGRVHLKLEIADL